MARGTVHLLRLAGTPEWIFPWRGSERPLFPRFLALVLTGAAFTLLVTTVKIQVDTPEKLNPGKASVIYLQDDAQGRALTLRAREGGPFPSRFELSQWQGLAELEASALDAVRYQPAPYTPVSEDLPSEDGVLPMELAVKGRQFLPKRIAQVIEEKSVASEKVAPVLYALSGISTENLPTELPRFLPPVDSAMSSASWRFLIRLNADGSVAECVSLEKGAEPGAIELESWLHRILFKPEPSKPVRWISVAVGFTNQPADGTDPR
ncbi:MAG: hypothetical protein EOP88_26820 [Verrucomicrobiaceae bacterium]|nr:MAG: hypothetical protein EOP88_26820 [Verrucomicrobiaceae bacterium]